MTGERRLTGAQAARDWAAQVAGEGGQRYYGVDRAYQPSTGRTETYVSVYDRRWDTPKAEAECDHLLMDYEYGQRCRECHVSLAWLQAEHRRELKHMRGDYPPDLKEEG